MSHLFLYVLLVPALLAGVPFSGTYVAKSANPKKEGSWINKTIR